MGFNYKYEQDLGQGVNERKGSNQKIRGAKKLGR